MCNISSNWEALFNPPFVYVLNKKRGLIGGNWSCRSRYELQWQRDGMEFHSLLSWCNFGVRKEWNYGATLKATQQSAWKSLLDHDPLSCVEAKARWREVDVLLVYTYMISRDNLLFASFVVLDHCSIHKQRRLIWHFHYLQWPRK